jgi:hypothetical protein
MVPGDSSGVGWWIAGSDSFSGPVVIYRNLRDAGIQNGVNVTARVTKIENGIEPGCNDGTAGRGGTVGFDPDIYCIGSSGRVGRGASCAIPVKSKCYFVLVPAKALIRQISSYGMCGLGMVSAKQEQPSCQDKNFLHDG